MKLLLDTQILIWTASQSPKLSTRARDLIEPMDNTLFFSAASLWEVAIKAMLGRPDFRVDARILRRGLLDNGYSELSVTSLHAVAIDSLPPLHKDPFDRLILAQAVSEGISLVTADRELSQYPGPIIHV